MTATQPQFSFEDPLAGTKLASGHRFVAEMICGATGASPLPIRELINRCEVRAQTAGTAERVALLRMKDRSIKEVVETLRLSGKPIVGRREKAKRGFGGGYFLARTSEELEEFSRTYGSQCFKMLTVLRRVQKANGLRLAGQGEFADLIREIASAI
jgi:hypothetical protein